MDRILSRLKWHLTRGPLAWILPDENPRKELALNVSIKYCKVWNYDPIAAGLAEAIQKEFGIPVKLIPSDGGVFDVRADGQLLFSKHETGRHIRDHEEVLSKLRQVQKNW